MNLSNEIAVSPTLGAMDLHLLHEGKHSALWHALGAHFAKTESGETGYRFAVWAPDAEKVSVVGEFNGWNDHANFMGQQPNSGIWEIFIPGVVAHQQYKFAVWAKGAPYPTLKSDPLAFQAQHPPETASVTVPATEYQWHDGEWLQTRESINRRDAAISIYEVHLGSWRKTLDGRYLSYRDLADQLVDYVVEMGFTHIEFMPVSEFPFDGSWGYQPISMFAPTSRFGSPDELRALIDAAHAKGIAVLTDWVPAHFPSDEHGLARFDGSALYEYADPKEGFHKDWNTLIYNFGRFEVQNFLIGNALFWLKEFHLDGLRVDAVASMLYRDYSRNEGEWIPNHEGGRENFEAMGLLRNMNMQAYGANPGIATFAEESTAFPKVSAPVDHGGLGFGYKWNMGWMNDTLSYMHEDPVHRKYHHDKMTFGIHYGFSENYVLPISHDEVVHGKGSMLEKMPGNEWEKFANLRAYYGFMWGHPGKKLLFMGCEFAQNREWNHNHSLDWHLLDDPKHKGMQSLVRDLNNLYKATPALHQKDCLPDGFEWLEHEARDSSVFTWVRKGEEGEKPVVVAVNMTPVERQWRLPFPFAGRWIEVLNTDAEVYGGGGRGNLGGVDAVEGEYHHRPASAEVCLPPLSAVFFQAE